MDNGCEKCKMLTEEHLARRGMWADILCLKCQLELAEWEAMRWADTVERIKQAIEKEKENESL